MPQLLRDAQVFSIWEGTTNVLSLDVVRAIEKENAFAPFLQGILERVAKLKSTQLAAEAEQVKQACDDLKKFLEQAAKGGADFVQGSARYFSYSLARTCAASLLLEHAEKTANARNAALAKRWCQGGLTPLLLADEAHRRETSTILSAGV
jgi:hypothetical protein